MYSVIPIDTVHLVAILPTIELILNVVSTVSLRRFTLCALANATKLHIHTIRAIGFIHLPFEEQEGYTFDIYLDS
jgi:hypothetical protein